MCHDGACRCDEGWRGPTCSHRLCVGMGMWTFTLCSGHGACMPDGTCRCADGWEGVGCATKTCAGGCGAHGTCQDGACFCEPQYTGARCEHGPLCGIGPNGLPCSGRATCERGTCVCAPGFFGRVCEAAGCNLTDGGACSGHGQCVPAHASVALAPAADRGEPQAAAALAAALAATASPLPPAKCVCARGWTGLDCGVRLCMGGCGEADGRGTCVHGRCWCLPGYVGDHCETEACASGCGADDSPPRGACLSAPTPPPPPSPPYAAVGRWTVDGRPAGVEQVPSSGFFFARRAAAGAALASPSAAAAAAFAPSPPPRAATSGISRCICRPGWTGSTCQRRACPTAGWAGGASSHARSVELPCSGRGECFNGTCACIPGYGGAACELAACPNQCSQRGVCERPAEGGFGALFAGPARLACTCDEGYTGDDCSVPYCPRNCSGVGHCSVALGHVCVCPPGRTGVDCGLPACPAGCDAPRGMCTKEGRCLCAVGWSGPACDVPTCDKACSRHGECTLHGCVCHEGWYGQDCAARRCAHGCFAHRGQGACHDGRCVCALGFSGVACNHTCGGGTNASLHCSGHGRCVDGAVCECEPGYGGAACERRTCLMGCSGQGLCHDGTCICAVGFGGRDCAVTTVPSPHDCSTGCVHLCASRCAAASVAAAAFPAHGAVSARAAAEIGAELAADGVAHRPSLTGDAECFTTCRRKCAAACHSPTAQRTLWATGRRLPPTAEIGGGVAASAALGLRVPTAEALPQYDRWRHARAPT